MRNGQKIDLGMTGYAELFMTDEERKTQTLPRIVDIPIEMIDDFPDHPFKVRMDEDMQQLVESIKENGDRDTVRTQCRQLLKDILRSTAIIE